jgi:D-psicose/D-tagatose/L-ribulose 3-epimerase
MKLAVSSIAWTNEEERDVAAALRDLGVKYVEVAPTKIWEDPTKATDTEITEYADFWRSYGIEIVAFQSMLFSRPDLKIFETADNRAEAQKYLQDFTVLAGKMGAQVMVFGSPKNRQRGDMPLDEATGIAKDFFAQIGDTAKANDVYFCIEPNPTNYACDFVTNAAEGIEFVQQVSIDGFGLHLDIAGMTLAHDDVSVSIKEAAPLLRHFHISSPMLEQVEDREDVHHRKAAAALKEIGYDRFVSIEMRPGAAGENVARVEKAVRFAQEIYS